MNFLVRRLSISLIALSNLGIGHAELPDSLYHRVFIIDETDSPRLELICLTNQINQGNFQYIKLYQNPMESVLFPILENNHTDIDSPIYISKILTSEFNEWMLEQPLLSNPIAIEDKNETSWIEYDFLKTNFLLAQTSQQIESFDYGPGFLIGISREIIDFSIEQQLRVLDEYALSEKILSERNDTQKATFNPPHQELNQNKYKKDGGGFAKFALYLLISGGAFLIYSVLAPAGSKGKKSTLEKIEEARRKRWLTKIYNLGWIDREKYLFLLKRLEELPRWLGGIEPPDQSDTDEVDSSVDLSKRKSGDSVVKTKETSSDNTSR